MTAGFRETFRGVEEVISALAGTGYLCDEDLATVVFLACRLGKPLLVEGPAGVGKTELAKALAAATGAELVRLQCYEGLDEGRALFEWNYHKQLLCLQAGRLAERDWEEARGAIFTPEFLISRPLLQAIQADRPAVLLIDELDKSDEEFESFLLETLSEYQVSIPELGTISARSIPLVVLTSNNSRDFGDALKRRCLHLYIDYPPPERELAIVRLKVPGIREDLARAMVSFIQVVRREKLRKAPGISETLDWALALLALAPGAAALTPELVGRTLPVLIKYRGDVKKLSDRDKLAALLAAARSS